MRDVKHREFDISNEDLFPLKMWLIFISTVRRSYGGVVMLSYFQVWCARSAMHSYVLVCTFNHA